MLNKSDTLLWIDQAVKVSSREHILSVMVSLLNMNRGYMAQRCYGPQRPLYSFSGRKKVMVWVWHILCINVAEGPLALTRKEGKIFQTEKQQNAQTFL